MTDMEQENINLHEASETTVNTAETAKNSASRRRNITAVLTYILAAAALIVLISAFFLPVYKVTGKSMEPTLSGGNIVLCSKYSDYSRGDIVAVNFGGKILIKRVIAVSGDSVDISADGTVTLNGAPLTEEYLTETAFGECDIELPCTVPENRVFLMGDNRAVSIDSRSTAVGTVADEFIVGKVIFRLSPIGRVS